MKTKNLLLLLFTSLLFASCETQTEKSAKEEMAIVNSQIRILPLDPQTRADNQYMPLWAIGEKMGIFIKANNILNGPIPFTLANGHSPEPIPFIDGSRHAFYAYHPYNVNTSTNPKEVEVTPIAAEQVQQGTSRDHINSYEFNIAAPASIYPDEELTLYFTSSYSFFMFEINSNINGLVVKNIKLEAPTGKLINFTDAKVDITLPENDRNFAIYYDVNGGSETTLIIEEGGLTIPNSTTDFATAYMVFNPFDSSGDVLKITVTTEDQQIFTFYKEGTNYRRGNHYEIPLYLEANDPPILAKK